MNLEITCDECGKTVLSDEQQEKFLAELDRQHAVTIECHCGKNQFILRARRRKEKR
jgi:RNase P subunit RPR2